MKKCKCILVFFLLLNLSINAQKEEQFKVRSLGYGFGLFGSSNTATSGDGGLSGILELGLNYKKNLFLINYLSGSSIRILWGPTTTITEFNLQAGRELKVNRWFSMEAYAGLGNFNQSSTSVYVYQGSAISIPLRLKLICYTGKRFALVSNSNVSLNTIGSNFSSNLTFQHYF